MKTILWQYIYIILIGDRTTYPKQLLSYKTKSIMIRTSVYHLSHMWNRNFV